MCIGVLLPSVFRGGGKLRSMGEKVEGRCSRSTKKLLTPRQSKIVF